MISNKQLYKKIIQDGCAVEYKQLSICILSDYYKGYFDGIIYQVDCEHPKVKHSELYKSLDKAVSKFLELKRKI